MFVTAISSSAEASLQNQKNPTLNQHHRGPGWCLCGASHHFQAISSTPAVPVALHIPGPWTISFFLLPEHSTYISPLEGSLFSFFSSSFGSELQCSNDVICLFCCCCYSITKLYPTLCVPMDCSTPGSSILHHLPEFAQIHVH